MKYGYEAHPRVWQSALALKIYFERKIGLGLELLREAPAYALLGDIPLGADLKSRGVWGIRPETPLNALMIDEIATTFRDVLKAKQKALERDVDMSNVIALKPRPRKKWQIKSDCLMECADSADLHKMAFEFHSSSSRYAFLAYSDLSEVTKTFIPDLLAMGSMTLFVPDITALPLNEQIALHQLMAVRSPDRPVVFAGTSRPLSTVRGDHAMHAPFIRQISLVYFKLTKPFADYKAQGLIQYFLDSLSHDRP